MLTDLEIERQLGRAMFNRVLRHLDDDELEFLRDAFLWAAEDVPGYPENADIEAFDFADLAHDYWEIRQFGRVVTGRTEM